MSFTISSLFSAFIPVSYDEEIYNDSFSDKGIEKETNELLHDIISYHSEGNINMQLGNYDTEEDIKEIQEEIFNFKFDR